MLCEVTIIYQLNYFTIPIPWFVYRSFVTPQSGKSPETSTLLQGQVASYVTAIRGLSFNPNSLTNLKNLNFLLNSGKLKQLSNIVIWYDVLNNSLTPHPSKGNSPLTTCQLTELLRQHRGRIAALIYCQRIGTTYIEFELSQTGCLVINVKSHLLSKRRRVAFSQVIRQLHPLYLGMGSFSHHKRQLS